MFPGFAKAGGSYFQQEVNYVIHVTLDDKLHTLTGDVKFDYINNSTDTLKEIYIHVWPNAYKNSETPLVKQQLLNGTTDLYFADDEDRGYMDGLQFTYNGKSVNFQFIAVDYGKIILSDPILPGGRATFSTPFFVKIPDARFSRMGHHGQAYYISQWYPKPAVYDATGWHPMSYLDIGEFYSEFGSFEVHITLPSNYVICATGELQDKDEVAWLSLKASGNSSVSDNSFPPSDITTKTLVYKQSGIHDFAWFADKRYLVQKGSLILPETRRRVDTWAFYTPAHAAIWKNATEYINRTILNYSRWNGDYIYSSCSVAEGSLAVSNGMEYPMVTIINSQDTLSLESVIVHEVGHNWFYGMLASNERDNPWMDEGLNSFNELRYLIQQYPPVNNVHVNDLYSFGGRLSRLFGFDAMSYKDSWQLEYDIAAATRSDQSLMLPSESYNWLHYGISIYRKTAIAFYYLKQYLGDEDFDRCMQNYFRRWNGKHPHPEDVKKVFEEFSGKKLSWFFDDLLPGTGVVDYKICGVNKSSGKYTVRLKNNGDISSPLWLYGMKGDSVITSTNIEGFSGSMELENNCTECTSFSIDYFRYSTDINRNNNHIYTSGLLKKRDPFSIGLFPKTNPANGRRLCVLPSAGWNEYNKWMAGVTFYNKTLPLKKFEYSLTALYGFGDNEPAGVGSATYNIYLRKSAVKSIGIGVKGKRFAYDNTVARKSFDVFEKENLHYLRWEPGVELNFRNKNPVSTSQSILFLSMVNVSEQDLELKARIDSPHYNITGVVENNRWVLRATFTHSNDRTIDPYSFKLTGEMNDDYQKLSFEGKYDFIYAKGGRAVRTRLFAGYENRNSDGTAYPLYLSGWSGSQDNWYDEYYFGRSERVGILAQQMSMHDGGFKVNIPYGSTADWLTALNINVDFPGSLPLSFFLDVGTFKDAKDILSIYNVDNSIVYDGGICVSLVYAKVYFPILRSSDIKAFQSGDFGVDRISFGKQIRFEIDLERLNPFYLRNQFSK
ncbi:MAG: M1 family metallopeptidase [Bacteroidota bacterium]